MARKSTLAAGTLVMGRSGPHQILAERSLSNSHQDWFSLPTDSVGLVLKVVDFESIGIAWAKVQFRDAIGWVTEPDLTVVTKPAR